MNLTKMLTNACLLGTVVTVALYAHTGLAGAQANTAALLPAGKSASQTVSSQTAVTTDTPVTITIPDDTIPMDSPTVTITQEWGGVTKLNSTTAIPLIVEAQKRYTYVMEGGQFSNDNGTFQYKGMSYRYLSEDIGTRAKLSDYLQQAFTRQASDALIGKFFIQYNGRMAQPDADGGSMLDWERSTAKMISMTNTARVYRLTVPYANNAAPVERIVVKFSLVDGLWKVNTAPQLIF
ncbi:DL-endopeptidase inhibitor IseA family protein [Paenibacillus campi]|uniref:DL-endopeptidase inhibitor IseA family protein n=1 Tax=Paenibacillus campi TaxID=3106031 RepID=UPI002AFF1026|nr:DL-endopeptidase inhibitor IseA family protein [Paenibacillus sp. SGZ-1014]